MKLKNLDERILEARAKFIAALLVALFNFGFGLYGGYLAFKAHLILFGACFVAPPLAVASGVLGLFGYNLPVAIATALGLH